VGGSIGNNFRLAPLLALTALLLSVACTAPEHLKPLNQVIVNNTPVSQVNVNFCTDPAYSPQQVMKMLIILDHSGSNQLNYKMAADGTGAPDATGGVLTVGTQYATDPQGLMRYGSVATQGTLLNYLNNVPANDPTAPSRYFALVDFSDSIQTYPSSSAGFTSDTVAFYNYVQSDATSGAGGLGPNDGGATDYLAALNSAYTIINNDIQAADTCAKKTIGSTPTANCPQPGVAVAASYVIVFMSDGAPITSLQNVVVVGGQYQVQGQLGYTIEAENKIVSQVATIQALNQNTKYVSGINLFTIYYYDPTNIDGAANSLLKDMAKAGNGIFYDLSSGSNINYDNFQPPSKQVRYTLADVFVTNASVTYWNDGVLHKDTDMDGLPDDVEVAWGSNPNKASTPNNGVSDLVRYRATSAAVCSAKNGAGICTDPVTNYATGVCSGISKSTIAGIVTYKAQDPDGLNDCEKLILNDAAGLNNPDSNADLIPDFLEFMAGVPFQTGTSPAVNTPGQDGYSVYKKIKYSMPQNVSAQQELNLPIASYNLQLVSSTSYQDCYNLTVNNIPTMGNNNMIRVDVVEKSALANQTYLYKVGKKAFAGSSINLSFADWTDPTEITNKTWTVWP
jgi:hypothetical protein